MHAPPPTSAVAKPLPRLILIAAVLAASVWAFVYTGGWLSPQRLSPAKLVNQLQANAGVFPGYRRNHAKGVCVTGYFESNGNAQRYSVAQVFAPGRTPVIGRLAIASGNPYAPDSSVPIRSLALRFNQSDGQQWRTGMNSMPVFPVNTPQGFLDLLQAQQPDPATGKPNPQKLAAFFASHPESAAFLAWVKQAQPSASFATVTYNSLNAFELLDSTGQRHAVRWGMLPQNQDAAVDTINVGKTGDSNYLVADLQRRLAQAPLRWQLQIVLADPGDSTRDATQAWPANRRSIDAGTLVLEKASLQDNGPCRDINYDPLVLPHGIEGSDDPLLAARSAAYANSYLRRTSEEAHLPGTAAAKPKDNP